MLLPELKAISLRISEAIESNDWEKLSEILIQRQARLEELLNAPLPEEELRAIEGIMESVQAMDKLFINAVQFKKTELLKQFQAVAQGQKVMRAYAEA